MSDVKLTRKEQAEETKKFIFQTALELLNEKEFDKITVRDIVKKANVSIGTFYHYYSTKLDVYYETYIIADEYFETVVKPKIHELTDTREKLELFFEYYAKYNCEITDITLTRILYNSANKCFDRDSNIGMIPILVSILEEGLETGALHSEKTPKELAQFFMISIRGQIYHWCTNDGNYDLKEAVLEHLHLLLKIFVNKKDM